MSVQAIEDWQFYSLHSAIVARVLKEYHCLVDVLFLTVPLYALALVYFGISALHCTCNRPSVMNHGFICLSLRVSHPGQSVMTEYFGL